MRRKGLTSYSCRLGEAPVQATIGEQALIVDGQPLAYVDMDEVRVDGWSVRLEMAGRPEVVLGALGRGRDDFLRELHAARSPVRRAALLEWTGNAPIDSYEAHRAESPEVITLFSDGLTIEPAVGPPTSVPLGLVQTVRREGYTIILTARGLPDVTIRQLGPRTDEFLADLDAARADLAQRTAAAYAALDPALAGLGAPDGWAVTREEAGRHWGALRAAVAGEERGTQVEALEQLVGDRLRLGIKAVMGGGSEAMPFALAPAGDRVAVEGSDTNARATYVFETEDVDRLNVVLLLISFRREAVYLPEDQLGRWAVAARVLEIVRWARSAFVGRAVHDAKWEANVEALLRG